MKKNSTVIVPSDTPCDNSSSYEETGIACDMKTGGEVVKSQENACEGKETGESLCPINVSELELIGGYQHNKRDNSVITGDSSCKPPYQDVKLALPTQNNSIMTGENTAKPSYHNVILGLKTPAPKSILVKQGMSASPRSKKLVRFALMTMEKDSKEIHLSSSDQNEHRNVNESLSDTFDQVSMHQTNIAVTLEKDGNASNFSDQPLKPMSVSNCNLRGNEVTESQFVCNSVSDELKSLVNIVREKSDNCIDSFSSVGSSKTNDNENKDSNDKNTSDSVSSVESKSDPNGGRKFVSPTKIFLSEQSPPKSSIFIRRGFPRIVLRDKSNKPQRDRKSISVKKLRGEECRSKYIETSHNSDPEHSDSSIVKMGRHICSGKSFTELKETSAALPNVENNKFLKILEVSLEKIDENLLAKYGLNIKDHNLSKLSKCPDRTSLQNVNDDLKENADIEKQKPKRRSTQITEKTYVGKNVGVNNQVLDTAEGLEEDFSSPEEECLKHLPIQTTEGIEKKEGRPNEKLRNTDTSISFPENEENNNVTSVSCPRSLSTSNMKRELVRKSVRVHIAPLDPVLLSKYGINLEHPKLADVSVELTGHNIASKIIDGKLINCDTKTIVSNENSTIHNSRNNVTSLRRSFLSKHLVPNEVVTLEKSDKDFLETGIQEGGISEISNSNLRKSKRNNSANSNDLKVKNAIGNNKAVSDILGDVEATRKITSRNVKSSIYAIVDGHEPTIDSSLDPINFSMCRDSLENQNQADNNAELTSHIIENKVSDGEMSACNLKISVNNEDSIAHDATNNVRRSRRSFLSNDPVAKEFASTDKSDGVAIETGIQKYKISNICDSNIKKSRKSIGVDSNDLKIFNAVVSINTLQLRGSCAENKIIGELPDCGTKINIIKEDSTPNDPPDNVKRSKRFASKGSVAKVVTADKSDGNTKGTGIREGRISDISGPNIKKSRKNIFANLNDWKILNAVGSNNTSNSGSVERVSTEISPRKFRRMSDGLVFEHKSTPKPDSSDQVNHCEVQKTLSKEDTILLNNSAHSLKVAIVHLSRIDCDLPRYGIGKGQLLGSSCEKVSLAKERNNLNDQGSLLTKQNEDQADSISTPKISPLDSPFKSKKRKRYSSNTADAISTSSERHSKKFKICKTE